MRARRQYGCIKTKVSGRKWTHWYKLPWIDYGDGRNLEPIPDPTLGSRQLAKGMTGADVREMQTTLLKLGYTLPKYGADGDFGSETEKAVIAFQQRISIKADGKYGEETHAALMRSTEWATEEQWAACFRKVRCEAFSITRFMPETCFSRKPL